MPVKREGRAREHAGPPMDAIVEILVRELEGGENQEPRPSIFEIPVGSGHAFHIIVVWEGWSGMTPDERTEAIVEAYKKTDIGKRKAEKMVPRITIAIGVSSDERSTLDILPFQIRAEYVVEGPPSERSLTHPEDTDEVQQAFLEEGGFRWGKNVILRLPTRQLAEESLEHMREKFPGTRWFVHQD